MGWYTDLKKKTRPVTNYLKRQSGKIARESLNAAAAVSAGTACAVPPLTPLAPACAVAAGYAVDAVVGDRVERVTKRTIDKTGTGAEDFVRYLRGTGAKAPRPPDMIAAPSGHAPMSGPKSKGRKMQRWVDPETGLVGMLPEPSGPGPIIAGVAAGSLVILVTVVAVLKRTGRI
jgi:hypothetical protein